MSDTTDLERILSAVAGRSGRDQERLATIGLKAVAQVLAKNQDYGGSAWQCPLLCPQLGVAEAIFVRLSDKVSRLRQLRSRPGYPPAVADETLRDTMADMLGYALLWLARPDPEPEPAEEPEPDECTRPF